MKRLMKMLVWVSFAAVSAAQTTAPSATGATAAAAPAALTAPARPARSARGAAGANAAGGAIGNGAPAVVPAAGAGTETGVPRYRAGFRGPKGTTAAVATDRVTVTGSNSDMSQGPGADLVYGTKATGGVPDADETLPSLDVVHFSNPLGIKTGSPIVVKLQQAVDSGHAHNGDILHGTLANPVGSVQAGSPVVLTVVAAAAAGQMSSYGELSLQVISIDGTRVLSNVVTAQGKEGKKLTADSAPERGTEAAFPADEPITLPAS